VGASWWSETLDASVDALSDVLDLIQMRGGELRAVRATDRRTTLHRAGNRLIHLVEVGPVELECDDGERFRLESGDLVLLATGAGHRLTAPPGAAWMSGDLVVDDHTAAPLLAVLPQVILISSSRTDLEWLPLGAGLLAVEIAEPTAGSRVMVSRLLELLLILALRAWSAEATASRAGWLTATLDRPLAPVLRALHRHPEYPWTVEELADVASLSRAAFAARFRRIVGESPARYVGRLRLGRAADMLAVTTDPVGSIARAVGFDSPAAFTRAFSREYGMSPRQWRTTHSAGSQ
jgi:AraC-like DNA-binding protein